ncbi:MAG TPA: nitrate- and nitrite sensing domain-containing protein [Jiangellales bacterium]|nr:nitrate- and nitrite sensing domain-containing protein [Jiangellales bacterium]
MAGHRRTHRRGQSAPLAVPAPETGTALEAAAAPDPPLAPVGPGGTVRRRLVGILALPVLAVVVLLGFVTAVEVADYRTSTATTRAVTLALSVQDLVQELQTERGLTAGLLGGNVGFRDEIPPSRDRVNELRMAIERRLTGGGEMEERVRRALRELDGLPVIRSGADAGTAGRAATFQFFSDRIFTLNGVDFGLDQASDPALRRNVAALQALGAIKESTAQERAFLNGVFSAGGFAQKEFLQFAAMRAAKQAALAEFARQASRSQRAANDYVLDTGAAREAAYFEQVALGAADGRHLQVNPQSWWSALTTVLDDMRQMQQHVGSEIQARAEMSQVQSTRQVALLATMVALCVAGAIFLLLIASRSITGPLAALAAEAYGVATHRLPAAVSRLQAGDGEDAPQPPSPVRVPERATSEIRSVADALDRVQSVAYALATEQAMLRRSTVESLANLGRRNQNLLRRQLGFITKLEREEVDPAGLANLFELDHLATRMRRNAESLLVLVGASSPRQWAAPLPISDVIRAAVSEVEEYRRVSIRRVDDAFVAGAVVSAVAHMLAELIENALAFSPPDAEVEIQGRRIADGDYLIAITDQGVGMAADDLARANARLRGEGDFVSAPTRYLGHYVVGQLAREMSVDVQLVQSPVTGITARVTLSHTVLAAPPAASRVAAVPVAGTPSESRPRTSSVFGSPPTQPPLTSPQVLSPSRAPSQAIEARPAPVVEYVTVPGSQLSMDGPTATFPIVVATVGETERPASAIAGERTANGLRKRLPRSRRPEPTESYARHAGSAASAGRSEQAQPLDDSPAQVRARLTALRAGMLRGQSEYGAGSGQPGAEGASTETWRVQ